MLRTTIAVALSLMAFAAAPAPAFAQAFPSRTITIIVNSEPGGPVDMVARTLKDPMSAHLGQTIVIENRPAAGGVVGSAAVKRADPDGYTLLVSGVGAMLTGPILFADIGYDPIADFQTVSLPVDVPTIFAGSAMVPATTLAEFIALAKSQPGKFTYGTAGRGTPGHFAFEAFRVLTGLDMLFIPYRGSPAAVLALISGELSIHIATPQAVLQHAEAGTVRLLAVTGNKRLSQIPNVPTMAEVGFPTVTLPSWFGYFAPKGTPKAVAERLHSAVSHALTDPKVIETLSKVAFNTLNLGPEAFGEFHKQEMERWRKVAQDANIKPQ